VRNGNGKRDNDMHERNSLMLSKIALFSLSTAVCIFVFLCVSVEAHGIEDDESQLEK
jgi:hypothetical protein